MEGSLSLQVLLFIFHLFLEHQKQAVKLLLRKAGQCLAAFDMSLCTMLKLAISLKNTAMFIVLIPLLMKHEQPELAL